MRRKAQSMRLQMAHKALILWYKEAYHTKEEGVKRRSQAPRGVCGASAPHRVCFASFRIEYGTLPCTIERGVGLCAFKRRILLFLCGKKRSIQKPTGGAFFFCKTLLKAHRKAQYNPRFDLVVGPSLYGTLSCTIR